MRIGWITLLFLIALVLAGCAPSGAGTLPPDPQPAPSEEAALVPTKSPLPFENTPESQDMPSHPSSVEKFVALVKKDLAERLHSEIDAISLVQAKEMVWPNAALGCPQPGKAYPPGKVPGYQIRLEAGGVEYVYNTDLSGQILLCPQEDPDNPGSAGPVTPGPTKHIGPPIQ